MTPDEAAALQTTLTLPDGRELIVRPVLPSDRDLLVAGFERLGPESRYFRFFSPIDHLSEAQISYFCDIDYEDHFAWVAGVDTDDGLIGAGVARYIRYDGQRDVAEAAVAVADDFQRMGIGRMLLEMLASSAQRNGVARFHLLVRGDNTAMIDLTRGLGAETTPNDDPGVLRFVLDVPEFLDDLAASPMYDLFSRVARGDATLGPRHYRFPS